MLEVAEDGTFFHIDTEAISRVWFRVGIALKANFFLNHHFVFADESKIFKGVLNFIDILSSSLPLKQILVLTFFQHFQIILYYTIRNIDQQL